MGEVFPMIIMTSHSFWRTEIGRLAVYINLGRLVPRPNAYVYFHFAFIVPESELIRLLFTERSQFLGKCNQQQSNGS